MWLHGSCHCGAVCFSVESYTPYPYMRCYRSICRKTAGSGGYAINLMGQAQSLKVQGRGHVSSYQAKMGVERDSQEGKTSPARRHFCAICGSALWIEDPRWPEWVYPFASAIDTPLPVPPEQVHIMLDFATNWCAIPQGDHDVRFSRYPKESIADWHRRHSLYEEPGKEKGVD